MPFPIKALSHVAFETADVPRLLAFYRDFLGFTVVYETSHSVMLRWGGKAAPACGLVLFTPESGLAPSGNGHLNHLGLSVPDRAAVDRCAKMAREAGCKVQGPVADDYVGYYCMVWDPDGNCLEFSAPEGVNRF